MKKRVLSLLLCLVFLLTLLPAVTLADPQTSGDYRDLHWEYNITNGRLDLSRADEGPMPEFEEASDVPWAAFRASITSIALNSTFTSISTYAFYGCNITSFDVPASVQSIGYGAFQGCTSLRTLAIGSGVRMIGAYAFNGCSALTSLPKDVKVKKGGKAKFTVKATGPCLQYQWYRKTAPDGDWELIDGATAASYTVVAAEDNNGWQFYCRVWNDDESADSAPATLTLK